MYKIRNTHCLSHVQLLLNRRHVCCLLLQPLLDGHALPQPVQVEDGVHSGETFAELQRRFFEDLCVTDGSIIGREPVYIVHYTRPESSVKQPNQN